jgi:hypothetical protein
MLERAKDAQYNNSIISLFSNSYRNINQAFGARVRREIKEQNIKK